MLASFVMVPLARADNLGQWSPVQPYEMHGVPIHMALVPGDGNPYSARVVWWGDGGGGVLGWRADGAACGAWPDTLGSNPNLVPLRPWGTATNLFCGTQITLASGDLASYGGTDPHFWGLDAVETYPRRVTGSAPGAWAPGNGMNERRWYPTATLLRTAPPAWPGQVLVAAGTKYEDLWFYGGRRGGSAPAVLNGGHRLERTGRVDGGNWDPSVVTVGDASTSQLPVPREGHTLVNVSGLNAPVLFGGSDSIGGFIQNPTTFVWTLKREIGDPQAAEYTYQWGKQPFVGAFPANRTEHAALAVSPTEMLIYGGTTESGQAFWRFYKDPTLGDWRWSPVSVSGSPPPALFGHGAVYDEHAYPAPTDTVRRMIFFGGSDTLGGAATDNKAYVFTFGGSGFTSGTWSELALSGGPPPLYNHAMAISPYPWGDPGGRIVWLYGGHHTSETLWRLEIGANNRDDPMDFQWRSATPADPNVAPGGRVGHTLLYDAKAFRLMLVGGSTAATPDRYLYQIGPAPVDNANWIRGDQAAVSLSGHAVVLDPSLYHVVARVPEIYDPVANTSTSHPLAARSEDYYPHQFLVPRTPYRADSCRVVVVGPEAKSQYLDIPASGQARQWNGFANGDPGFSPSTAAMYQPGKILVASGTVANPWPTPQSLVGNTSTLDAANLPGGPGWQAADTMAYPRVFHNLVPLPTGQVLAVGGMTGTTIPDDWDPANAATTPEVWDPDSRAWMSLQANPGVARNYHACAVLLLDARVLQGGGWWFDRARTLENPHWKKLQLFCPPYLFQVRRNDPGTPPGHPVGPGHHPVAPGVQRVRG